MRSQTSARVGVCWTRNLVTYNASHKEFGLDLSEWAQVHWSLATLQRSYASISTCLFTEPPALVVAHALFALDQRRALPEPTRAPLAVLRTADVAAYLRRRRGISVAGRQGLDAFVRSARGPGHVGTREAHTADKFLSRMGRLLNLLAAPFAATLFLDDDTIFCSSPRPGVLAALLASSLAPSRAFPQPPAARLVELALASRPSVTAAGASAAAARFRPRESARRAAVRACVRRECSPGCAVDAWLTAPCVPCAVECEDAVGLDGAWLRRFGQSQVLVGPTERSRAFVRLWLGAYLGNITAHLALQPAPGAPPPEVHDQPSLSRVALASCLQARGVRRRGVDGGDANGSAVLIAPLHAGLDRKVDQRFYRRKDEPRASAGARGNASGAHAPRQWVHVLHVQHGAASLEERHAVRGVQALARACAWVQQELADDTDIAEP